MDSKTLEKQFKDLQNQAMSTQEVVQYDPINYYAKKECGSNIMVS